MEADISDALASLNTRLEYQEHLHREVNPKTNSFVHWDNTHWQVLLISVLVSAAVAFLVVKQTE